MYILGTCFSIENVPSLLYGVSHSYWFSSTPSFTILTIGHDRIIKDYNFRGVLCNGKVVENQRFTLIIDDRGEYILVLTGKTADNHTIKVEMVVA